VERGTAVRVTGLVKQYPDGHRAVDGVDLVVEPGEMIALVGSNGAGKSTLLRCLVRLVEPTAGCVSIDGIEVVGAGRRELRAIRRNVGFVFQRFNLVPRLTVFHNVLHGAMGARGGRCCWPSTAPAELRREVMASLDRVGLAGFAARRVDTLSGGQQQRVAIARALLQRPRLVLADEPVASLDPVAGVGVMVLLAELAEERGMTVIAALHQVDLALRFTGRIVGLQHGRVVLDRATPTCVEGELDRVYALATP
jgi:phosphonate transport system ATP-binding protein